MTAPPINGALTGVLTHVGTLPRTVAAALSDVAADALASTTTSPPAARSGLFADATAAIAELGPGPLAPTGPVRDALAAGRLLRTGDPSTLDAMERVLRTGVIDHTTQLRVGGGMNGDRYRMRITPPAGLESMGRVWAVEKPVDAQAAQEEFAWLLARELGIDHLVPAVGRRADGSAWITFETGTSLSLAGVTDVERLDQALTTSYLDDATLRLSPAEAAQAGRIDRQLLQLLDYALANNDRHAANGLFDAAAGARLKFIDFGHSGRGTATKGATLLEPALRTFQAGDGGGHVTLDQAVVDLVRARVHPERVRSLHEQVYHAPGIDTPRANTIGNRFHANVNGTHFREGVVQRLQHAVDTGGYTHHEYVGDNAGELPPLDEGRNPIGFRNVRMHFAGLDRF